jgi:hypothetical protein
LNRYKLYITAGLALASLIAAPTIHSFGPIQKSFLAEGSPLPPVPPGSDGHVFGNSALIAEGSPLPPVPPTAAATVTVAEGSPLPPVPPGSDGHIAPQLIAEGSPLPPVPPGLAGPVFVS